MLLLLIVLGDDIFITNLLQCLAILLTTSKMKKNEGDIPYLMKFVLVCIRVYMYTIATFTFISCAQFISHSVIFGRIKLHLQRHLILKIANRT